MSEQNKESSRIQKIIDDHEKETKKLRAQLEVAMDCLRKIIDIGRTPPPDGGAIERMWSDGMKPAFFALRADLALRIIDNLEHPERSRAE